jgi:serine/threonine-protein kinase
MEFVEGPALRWLINHTRDRREQVPLPVWLALAEALLAALEHAHRATDGRGAPLHVVHRDVTPANVLVSTSGELKLVDFGLVQADAKLHRTQTGQVRGTVPYMSFEQAHGLPVDERTDVHAAAATLYELLTLARAFPEGPTEEPAPAPSSLRPELPADLDRVLLSAMAHQRSQRPRSAAELWMQISGAFSVTPAPQEAIAAWVKASQAAVNADQPPNGPLRAPQTPEATGNPTV